MCVFVCTVTILCIIGYYYLPNGFWFDRKGSPRLVLRTGLLVPSATRLGQGPACVMYWELQVLMSTLFHCGKLVSKEGVVLHPSHNIQPLFFVLDPAMSVDPPDGAEHISLMGADHDEVGNHYCCSFPFEKAVDPFGDCLIAYEMNGQPIPRPHGFPVRAIVPGHAGARHCKYLQQITVTPEPCLDAGA
jgi:hypothetical protein